MNSNSYPKSPELSNYDFVKPSPTFRNVATTVIFSIIAFFLFYLVLVALATAIMIASGWAGITIIAAKPNYITIGVGGGIIALGVMFFIFLFKFIFSRTKNENPFRREIREEEHPELFKFIRALNTDTKTKFPKKIFVSPEVNAMVFYNSSFWSLFFPVRKNLEIGLGLVNTLSISEFKAVLAHEFGHFSQRSMKVGSYIYTVNRVIYNLVYEYDEWDNTISRWAQTGGIFGFFAGVTFWLVERIRSLLKVAYNLININYMKLSREMEYHADLIAVSVSGNKPFKSALRKIEFSSFAYDYTTNYLNHLAAKEKSSNNIFKDHSYTLSFLAKHNKISSSNGELDITESDLENNVVKSRVNIENQWASHPTLREREDNISKVNVECEENTSSAWTLFSKPENLQKVATEQLYQIGFPQTSFKELEVSEYEKFVQSEINKYKLSERYNGFYEERYLSTLEIKSLIKSNPTTSFEQLYSKENVEKIKRLETNKVDLEILKQIHLKRVSAKYFEFDGKKYKRKDAAKLMRELKQEIEAEEIQIKELDQESFRINFQNAKQVGLEKELVNYYQDYFLQVSDLKLLDELNIRFQNFANRLYSQPRWTEEEVKQLATELFYLEKEFKSFLQHRSLESMAAEIDSSEQQEVLREYMNSNNYYAKTSEFDEQSFINLYNLVQDVYGSISVQYGNTLKKMTDYQLELLDKSAKS